jgi:chemotaxis protein MotB
VRRKRAPEPENHERWLVSYADFITLLFAFFVMMYANSQVDKVKARQISESFRAAIDEGRVKQAFHRLIAGQAPSDSPSPMAPPSAPPPPQKPHEVELLPSLRQLRKDLDKEISSGRLEVRLEKRGLVISLRESAFFPPGNDQLEPSASGSLATIAAAIRDLPNPVRLEGHTDALPIHTARFRSNWDLSAARAVAVLEIFRDRFGIPAERMAVSGFAETAPVASNETPEGRARNRRVDVVVLNELGMIAEPPEAQGSSSTNSSNKR